MTGLDPVIPVSRAAWIGVEEGQIGDIQLEGGILLQIRVRLRSY
jgi:hypothetical protein